jgi:hypothetical protein
VKIVPMRRALLRAFAIVLSCGAASADNLRKSIAVAGFDGSNSLQVAAPRKA